MSCRSGGGDPDRFGQGFTELTQAYFAFIRHPFAGQDSAHVAERLAKKAGVLCIPGAYFGDHCQDYLRFAFANADSATIDGLVERLSTFKLD